MMTYKFPVQKYFPSNSYQEFLDLYIKPDRHVGFLFGLTPSPIKQAIKGCFKLEGGVNEET